MTDLEYDLKLSIELASDQWEDSEAEVDCEETAKHLTKMGYQKIKWHKVSEEDFPRTGTRVLGYYIKDGHELYDDCYYGVPSKSKFARITAWGDSEIVDVIAWMELPKFNK